MEQGKAKGAGAPPPPGPTTLGDLNLGASKVCPAGYTMRKAYTTKAGVHVAAGCTPGGRTPPSGKVLPRPEPGGLHGWKHDMPAGERHKILEAVSQEDGCGTALKRLNLLANFTKVTSPETRKKARADMAWLRARDFCHLKSKKK